MPGKPELVPVTGSSRSAGQKVRCLGVGRESRGRGCG